MIQHLETKCQQLQGQYEIAMDTIGKSDDGTELSVGYFTIKVSYLFIYKNII